MPDRLRLWLMQRRQRRQAARLVREIRAAQALPARLLAWSSNTAAEPLGTSDSFHPRQERGRGGGLGWMAYRLDRVLQSLPFCRGLAPGRRLFLAFHRTVHRLGAMFLPLLIRLSLPELLNRCFPPWTPSPSRSWKGKRGN